MSLWFRGPSRRSPRGFRSVRRTSSDALSRAIFLRLVTSERTRSIVNLDELAPLGADKSTVDTVVQHLAAARLLLVDAGGESGGTKVELVHESLIERWSTLSRWIAESAGDAMFLARVRAAAVQWKADGEPTGLLWRDKAADEARSFFDRIRDDQDALVNPLEERYLHAVIAFSDRGRRRKQRQIAAAFASVCVISLLVSVLAWRARVQAQRADEEAAHVRKKNEELAFQALVGRNTARILGARKHQNDPTAVLALLREVEPAQIPNDWSELVSTALSSGVAAAEYVFEKEPPVYYAVMNPDGSRIAVALNDGTVRLLDANRLDDQTTLRGHSGHVWSVEWSPDGKRVVSASGDKTARIWFVDGSAEPIVLRGHEMALNSAKWSPDGQRVVTTSDDATTRLWRASDGQPLAVIRHDIAVNTAEFSPDGTRLLTASADGMTRIWNADGQGQPLVLRGHTDIVLAASFSPDNTRVATASIDRTVRIWDAQNGNELFVLRGHEDKAIGVDWSHDGKRIASSSRDKTVRIWNANGGGEPLVLRGHGHWVYTAKWSPDDRRIVTASLDKRIRIWNVDSIIAPVVLRGHDDIISHFMLSPDSNRVATISSDNTTRVWNVDASGQTIVLRGHTRPVVDLDWSPDSARIVTISADRTARIWTVDGSQSPIVIPAHDALPKAVSWNPLGEPIAIASIDGTIRFLSADGKELAMVRRFAVDARGILDISFDPMGKRMLIFDDEHDTVHLSTSNDFTKLNVLARYDGDTISDARWNRDGSRVYSISNNHRRLRVWNVDGSEVPWKLDDSDSVVNAAWSPDAQQIATMYDKGTIRIRRIDDLGSAITIKSPGTRSGYLGWSPDGTRLLSTSNDNIVRVWNANGTGVSFSLIGATAIGLNACWSNNGNHILVRSEEKVLRIWPDIQPFSSPNDDRLWSATSYCPSPALRVDLLNVTLAQANIDDERCRHQTTVTRAATR